jgi:VanZ family protein
VPDGLRRRGGLILKWGPVAIYILLIFYLSSISNPRGIPPIPHFDKIVHFGEYGVLGFLLGRALGLTRLRRRYVLVFAAYLLLGGGIGVADEFYQGTVQGREKSIADFVADLLGLLGAAAVLRAWAERGSDSGKPPPPPCSN